MGSHYVTQLLQCCFLVKCASCDSSPFLTLFSVVSGPLLTGGFWSIEPGTGPASLRFSRASVAPKNTLEQQDQKQWFQLFVLGKKKKILGKKIVLLAVFPEHWALVLKLSQTWSLPPGERDAEKQSWDRAWGPWDGPASSSEVKSFSVEGQGASAEAREGIAQEVAADPGHAFVQERRLGRALLICVRHSSRQEKKTAGKSLGTEQWSSEGNRGCVAVGGEAARGRGEGRAGPVRVCRAPLLRVVAPETPACRDTLVSIAFAFENRSVTYGMGDISLCHGI